MKAKPRKSPWGSEWVCSGCAREIGGIAQMTREGKKVHLMHLGCYKRQGQTWKQR
jgi:hypothetical protein